MEENGNSCQKKGINKSVPVKTRRVPDNDNSYSAHLIVAG